MPASLRISQYWDSPDIPPYIQDRLAGFAALNPGFRHTVLDRAETERFIAERFGQRELSAFQACAVPSMQSDYFRYCTVLALGGVYADADFRCARPLAPLVEDCEGGEIFLGPAAHTLKGRDASRIWSGFFAFREPGHPFLELALEIATANVEARIPERIWGPGENVVESIWLTVGPGIFTALRNMREWGSFDAFVEQIADLPVAPFGELYCEVIGDFERLVRAFDGVRVSPFERMISWVERPEGTLPYKETDVHWKNVRTGIFR